MPPTRPPYPAELKRQILDGIHRVILHTPTKTDTMIEGLTDIRIKILRLFGTQVCQISQISQA